MPSRSHVEDIEILNESLPLLLIPSSEILSKRNRLAFAVGHVLNDISVTLWFTYSLVYFQAVIGMSGAHAGAILLLGQIVNAFATPVIGYLADKTRFGNLVKYGRRKIYHLIGTILVIFSFPFIFLPCHFCDVPILFPDDERNKTGTWDIPPMVSVSVPWWQNILFYASFVIIFQIGWAIVQISHLSLIPELTSDNKGYTQLTSIRFGVSEISTITVYFITWCVFHVNKNNDVVQIQPHDAYKFKDIVLICVTIGVVFVTLFHFVLKEPESRQIRLHEITNDKDRFIIRNNRIEKSTSSYFCDPKLYQVACLYVCSRLFDTLIDVFMPLYLDESVSKNAESVALVPLTINIASLTASFCVKFLNQNCGHVFSYLLGTMLCLLGVLEIYFDIGQSSGHFQIYFIAILLGCGSSITTVTSLSITADLIGANTNSGASIYSAVTFADKLLNGIVIMTIEGLKCNSIAKCPHYYRDTVMPVCVSTLLFSLTMLGFYSKCTV